MNARILIIEDEVRSAQWLKVYLERAGFSAETAFDGQAGLDLARKTKPDLILLDLMLPRMSGEDVCRHIRSESDVPVIMLTAKGSRENRIQGFGEGADDYIVKPYEIEEVIARVKAVLRRTLGTPGSQLACGKLSMDEVTETVFLGDEKINVSHAQFRILAALVKNPGAVLSRRQLIELAFDDDFDAYERAIDTHIKRLRKLIHSENFRPIQTVYGGGYKLICEPR